MKITTLNSNHKKYIKKYGAKKASEKYNLSLTKAKSYENRFKKESYQGKRSLNKNLSSMGDDSDIFQDSEESKHFYQCVCISLDHDPLLLDS